ncbi:MAG: hypothetical protein ACLTJG_08885 [[Clostridium] innocuum]
MKRKEKKENISFDTAKAVGYSVYDIPFAKGSAADEFAGKHTVRWCEHKQTTPVKALMKRVNQISDEYNKKRLPSVQKKVICVLICEGDGTISSTDQLTESI